MGPFRVPIQVGNPAGRRFAPLEALVDTASTYLSMPGPLLEGLGVPVVAQRPFILAEGRRVEYRVGLVSLRLQGQTLPVPAVFAPEGASPLLGAVVLEVFGLAVDPVAQRLVPTAGLLMRFR